MCEAEEHTGLNYATKIRGLNVSGLPELEELPSIQTCNIDMFGAFVGREVCEAKEHTGLEHATELRSLVSWLSDLSLVSGLSDLEELPSMGALSSLEELGAEWWVKLKSIQGWLDSTYGFFDGASVQGRCRLLLFLQSLIYFYNLRMRRGSGAKLLA